MKAWRLNAASVNARRAAGSKEPKARVQMQEQRMLDKTFPKVNAGNFLLNGLLYANGYLAPSVYTGSDLADLENPMLGADETLGLSGWWAKAKRALGM